jgi:hypothetical protein
VSSFVNKEKHSSSRALSFAKAMVQKTLQTAFRPSGDAELYETAGAMIGKVRRSLREQLGVPKLFLTVAFGVRRWAK